MADNSQHDDFAFTDRQSRHRAGLGDVELQFLNKTKPKQTKMKMTRTQTIKTATPLATAIAAIATGAITLLLLATTAHANIGDTYQQSCWRYGKPAGRDSETGEVFWWLAKDLSVSASFGDPKGRCDGVRYANWSNTKAWNESDLRTLIAFNMIAVWQEIPSVYGRAWSGGDRMATYANNDPTIDGGRVAYVLGIATRSCIERFNAKRSQDSVTSDQAPDINSLPDMAKPSPTPEGHRELQAPKETPVKWLVGPDNKDLPNSLV